MRAPLVLMLGLILMGPAAVLGEEKASSPSPDAARAGDTATTQPTSADEAAASLDPAPQTGPLMYRLSKGAPDWDPAVRRRIVEAMDAAVAAYNRHGHFEKAVVANYSPGTPTADANYNGWINFGGQIGFRTALHEIGHTLGVGTHPDWRSMIKDGKWTGEHANRQLREFDGPDAVLKADRMHFWPYGLNYDKEGSDEEQVRRHILIVHAIRRDLGIVSE